MAPFGKDAHSPRPRRLVFLARLAALLFGVIITALAVSALASIVMQPFVKGRQSERELAEVRRTVEEKTAERDALRDRVEWLKSHAGAMEMNRQQGMVKPGEHAVRVEVEPPQSPEASAAPATPAISVPYVGIAALFLLAFGISVVWLLLRRRAAPRPDMGVLTPRSSLRRQR